MSGELVYEVIELPVTPEDRAKHNWSENAERVYWLIHYTQILENGFPLHQTPIEKVAWFNFNSDAAMFQFYLKSLQDKCKGK